MNEKIRIKLKVTVSVEIECDEDMKYQELIDEFSQETHYEFGSTENVKVINTEFLDCRFH